MEIRSGMYRKHLSGEAAYHSFVPLGLREIVSAELGEGILWHEERKIRDGIAQTEKTLRRFRDRWASAGPGKQETLKRVLLRREAEASVCMAWPRNPVSASGFGFTELFQQGGASFSPINPMQLQPGLRAETESPLENVPGDFREMAGEDMENLFQASERSLEMMNSLPLSGRLLKELHYMTLYAGHYDKMYRGEFRRSPVWIGAGGQDLRSAEFVPPVGEDMDRAFSELEMFLHYEESVHPLVKAALIHYQFETIHPFLDGNGRIGRLLVLLYLKEVYDLECPWIPLSAVLLQGIDRYYKEIRTVQLYGNYAQWTRWFLKMLDEAIRTAE